MDGEHELVASFDCIGSILSIRIMSRDGTRQLGIQRYCVYRQRFIRTSIEIMVKKLARNSPQHAHQLERLMPQVIADIVQWLQQHGKAECGVFFPTSHLLHD